MALIDLSVLLSINVCTSFHGIAVFQKEIKPSDVSSRLKKTTTSYVTRPLLLMDWIYTLLLE